MKTSIILLAAGKGIRIRQPKRDVKLAGKTLLQWNLELINKLPFSHELTVVTKGGKTRHESVKIGLKKSTGDIVIIHNVANPLASPEDFIQIQNMLIKKDAACFVGQRIVDTVRKMNGTRSKTIPRDHLWRTQTPQGFRKKTLMNAFKNARGKNITDEIMLFENSRTPIIAFETSPWNQKITFSKDLEMMERFLSTDMRVGIGEDSHAFDTIGALALGGVKLTGFPKLKANSDGDVILHALCNALRSAMGKGSFSAIADPMCKEGITDSKKYVQKIINDMNRKNLRVNQIAISLKCQKPNIDPLVPKLKRSLEKLLSITKTRIGITATSGGKKCIECKVVLNLLRFQV